MIGLTASSRYFLILLSIAMGTVALAERPSCFRFDSFWDNNSVAFSVNGTVATMNGVIDGSTPAAVRSLLRDHPNVERIEMDYVPGSDNDAANVAAARLVRDAGIATHIVANGVVASGGVDFFLAGAVRTIDPAVCEVGVHSWAGGGIANPAALPRTHPEHLLYLSYYRDMGIDDEFYFFTLDAAPANDIYNMYDFDIAMFSMTGTAVNPGPARPDIKIGKRAGRQAGNNTYSNSGKGQTLKVLLKGRRTARHFFTAENDAVVFDYARLRISAPKRTMSSKTFRLTGGRKNISAIVKSRGYPMASLDSRQSVQFQSMLKAKSKGARVRQDLKHTISSDLQTSRKDVAVTGVSSGK